MPQKPQRTSVGLTAKSNKADAQKLLAMVERFEDHDDVQAVYSNFDIPEEILAEIEE